MDSIISGTFKMIIRGGSPYQLFFDDDFLQIMNIKDNSDPESNFRRWLECVHPDDVPLLKEAIQSTLHGLKAEVKYRWHHRTWGTMTAYSSGMLVSSDNGVLVIYGMFKGIPAGSTPLYRYDPDIQLLTRLFAEKMLDSFSFCALLELDKDHMYILNDSLITSFSAGRDDKYEQWRRNIVEKIHPDDRVRFAELFSRDSVYVCFNVNDEVHGEFRLKINGEYTWFNFRCVKMKKRLAGKYSAFIVARRITADHKALYLEELRNQLINGLAVPYQILDLINLSNGSFYSTTDKKGLYAENFDVIGKYSEALVRFADQCECSDEDRNAIIYNFSIDNMMRRFAAGERYIECEICQRRIGQPEWLRIQAFVSSREENGTPRTAILTVQPITDEKLKELRYQQRLERALRSESQYRQAILSNAVAVYTFNITRDTIYDEIIEQEDTLPLLPLMGLTLPCSYDEYIRRKKQYITDKDAAEFFGRTFCTKTLADMFNSHRRSFDTEYEFYINNKKGYFREAIILTQDLETGDLWGLTYVRDVTEEHDQAARVELALRDAFDQAQHANSAKTLFMSQMSHDIRTPLNSILGMSAIAREHIDDMERVNDCLEKIETSGKHLLEIVNNILDLSAIESGKTVLACDPFDLRAFLDETIRMMKPLADKKSHTLDVKISSEMNTSVLGDQTKLRQLLVNIIGNAVKYTPKGGRIEFRAIELEPDHHGICRYLFSVTDNGIGMKPEFIEHIFDPFVRADDHRISGIQGTGLGMPISLNIARMMNGDIGVNSVPGKGSRFDITVCLKKGQGTAEYIGGISMEENRRVRMSDHDFGGARVLLAEDLEFNAEIASEFLAEANIVTDIAHDGAEAVKMFSQSPVEYYSLIFMDIQMPSLDGYQASDRIRSLDRSDAASVPIIAMTANAFIEDIKKSKEHGMNGHVSKPLDITALSAELCKWLPQKEKQS